MAQPNSKPWLPIGYMTAEKAAFKFNIPERYMTNPKNEKRYVLHKMMACKGLCHCRQPAQSARPGEGWLPLQGPMILRQRERGEGLDTGTQERVQPEGEKKSKGAGHISKDSSDDLDDQAQKDALDSFAIDKHGGLAGGGAKKTTRKTNETYQWMSGGLAVGDHCASPTQPCSPDNVAVSSFDSASMIRASGRGWS